MHAAWQHGAFTKVLDALSVDDIDTDCNGVIAMADRTVTMTPTRRRALSQEEIEAFIELPLSQLRLLAARIAVEELPVLRSPNGTKATAMVNGIRYTSANWTSSHTNSAFTEHLFRKPRSGFWRL